MKKRNQPTQLGTQRRLQAPMARSWSMQAVARSVGPRARQLARALENRGTITPKLAAAVSQAYDQLCNKTPPVSTPAECALANAAGTAARLRGWDLPEAWRDDQIDQPDAQPAGSWMRTNRTTRRPADLAEDARFLHSSRGHDHASRAPSRSVSALARRSCRRRAARSGQRSPPTAA